MSHHVKDLHGVWPRLCDTRVWSLSVFTVAWSFSLLLPFFFLYSDKQYRWDALHQLQFQLWNPHINNIGKAQQCKVAVLRYSREVVARRNRDRHRIKATIALETAVRCWHLERCAQTPYAKIKSVLQFVVIVDLLPNTTTCPTDGATWK